MMGFAVVSNRQLHISIPGRGLYQWTFEPSAILLVLGVVILGLLPRGAARRGVLEVAGCCLLALSGTLAIRLPLDFVAGVTLVVAGALWWLNWRWNGLAALLRRVPWEKVGAPPAPLQMALAIGIGIVLASLGWWQHAGIPYVVDSAAELFHARILKRGLFVLEAPPHPEFFWLGNIYCGPRGWFSQYTPGHMAWLALFDLANLAWAANSFFGAGVFLLTWKICDRFHGPAVGCWSAMLLALSPYFLQMQSGFMSHGSTAFFILLAIWQIARLPTSRRPICDAAIMGLALGIAAITRPLTVVGFLPLLLVWGAVGPLRRLPNPTGSLAASLAAAAIPASFHLAFNWVCNGSPFATAYSDVNVEYTQYGFTAKFPPAQGLAHVLNNLYLLDDYFLPLPCGGFLLALLPFVGGRPRRTDWLCLGLAACLALAYFPYHYQDGWYGPRFMYEALPLLAILAARGVEVLIAWGNRACAGSGPLVGALALALAVGSSVPFAAEKLGAVERVSSASQRPIMRAVEPVLGDASALVFVGTAFSYTVAPLNARWPDGPLFALDLGREKNRALVEALPERRALRYDAQSQSLVQWDAPEQGATSP